MTPCDPVSTSAPGEPAAGPWRRASVGEVAAALLAAAGDPPGRPRVVAVDGRSAGGKTTLALRLRDTVPGAAVVHTDDIAWHHSFFGWDALLADHVLRPLRRGLAVAYRPPGWVARGRPGAVEVPAGTPLVLVEGVGAARRSLAPLLDAAVWVQSDRREARRRGIARDGGTPEAESFWDEWEAEEVPLLAAERPWERAAVVVCGTPREDAGPEGLYVAVPVRG